MSTDSNTQAAAAQDADRKLSKQLADRGIEPSTWNTLKNSVFPGGSVSSILMAIDYCIARKLDVLKKPCHIVPMQVKMGADYVWRDVILPGIYEYRITAHRTGLYLGHTKPEYGPEVGPEGYEAPQWCDMTFYRWNAKAEQKVEFPVRVYYREVVGLNKEGEVNARWSKAPIQMLTKCTEAAGLREAFPDEIGGEPTMEEMIDQIVDGNVAKTVDAGMSRTEAAKERLRAQLTNQAGTGGLADMGLEVSKTAETANLEAQNEAKVRSEPKRTEPKKEEPKKEGPKVKFTEAQAEAALRGAETSAIIKDVFRQIWDDYDFTARELPIKLEALYRDLKESLVEREAIAQRDAS